MGRYSATRKEEALPFVTPQMDLKEVSQTNTNTARCHLHVEAGKKPSKSKLKETVEVVARGWRGAGENRRIERS